MHDQEKENKAKSKVAQGLIKTRTEIRKMETIDAKYKGKRADCLKGKKIDKNPGSAQKRGKKNQFKTSKMKKVDATTDAIEIQHTRGGDYE